MLITFAVMIVFVNQSFGGILSSEPSASVKIKTLTSNITTIGKRGKMRKFIAAFMGVWIVSLLVVNQNFAGVISPANYTRLKTLNSKTTNTKTSVGITSPTIYVNPGDDIQALVEANPPGTTFILRAGVHRFTTQLYWPLPPAPWVINGIHIRPKSGNVFLGEPGAVLNGSRLLTNFVPYVPERNPLSPSTNNNRLWAAGGQTQEGERIGPCEADRPTCIYPEDLFVDDELYYHAENLAQLSRIPRSWYFDYDRDQIIIAFNPVGHKIETGIARHAFANPDAHDVVIKNLIIEKYATAGHTGTIVGEPNSSHPNSLRWIVENNEIRYNHGAGIRMNTEWRVKGNYIHHNGQLGASADKNNGLLEGNQIAYNNTAGYAMNWEAGGVKFVAYGFTMRGNHVHHNAGFGLWADVGALNTLYEGNVVEYNTESGIFHEISGSAIIRNNTIRNNSLASIWGAEVYIDSSENVEVYGNVITALHRGIFAFQDDRPPGLNNLYVHDNTLTVTSTTNMIAGVQCLATGGCPNIYLPGNNRFDRNTYQVNNNTQRYWYGSNGFSTFPEWQASGQDRSGRIIINPKTTGSQ